MPPLNGFGILGRVGIFHGPTSCQPETVLAEEGTRQNVLNSQPYIPIYTSNFVIFTPHRRHFRSAQCVQGLGFTLLSQAPVTQAKRQSHKPGGHCIRLFSALGLFPLFLFLLSVSSFFSFFFVFFFFFLFLFFLSSFGVFASQQRTAHAKPCQPRHSSVERHFEPKP